MSSDFEGYEQDFAVLTAEITSKIARVPRLPPGESPAPRRGWRAGPGGSGVGGAVERRPDQCASEARGWSEAVLGPSEKRSLTWPRAKGRPKPGCGAPSAAPFGVPAPDPAAWALA